MKKSEKQRLEKQLKLQRQAQADRHLAKVRNEDNKILKKNLTECLDREKRMHQAMNAAMIEVAIKFGEKTEDGWVFSMPAPSARNNRDFEIRTEVNEDRTIYTTFVKKRETDEADDQGDAAGAE